MYMCICTQYTALAGTFAMQVVVHAPLRFASGRKRERIRQQGPLIYTPGALTWNVSIVLRDNQVGMSVCMAAYVLIYWRRRGSGTVLLVK